VARLIPADSAGIAVGADLLAAGELVAFPTETVYGLGADATQPDAVRRVFAAKGRPADHPLIVHVLGAADLDAWATEVPSLARALAAAFWPGPLTLVLPRAAGVCDEVTGGQGTVGLRCPSHPVARALIAALAAREPGDPASAPRRIGIAAPSANRFGRISPSLAAHVAADFDDVDLLVLDGGACDVGIESTIVDLSRGAPVVLRPGAITAAQIAAVARAVEVRGGSDATTGIADDGGSDSNAQVRRANTPKADDPACLPDRGQTAPAPRVSGSLASHYAPRKPLLLLSADAIAALHPAADWAVLAFNPPQRDWAWQSRAPLDPRDYAHGLYAWLHAMDGSPARRLAIEQLPATPEWAAVADRLGRAAFSESAASSPE